MVYPKKTLTITAEQEQWLKTNNINLSKFLQQKINEAMSKKQMSNKMIEMIAMKVFKKVRCSTIGEEPSSALRSSA